MFGGSVFFVLGPRYRSETMANAWRRFDRGFWKEYWSLVEKDEPVEEFEDRARLYEL